MTRGATFAAVTGVLPVLLGNVPGGHLGVESTIGDLLRHPAFAGFARLILPWDGRAYDEQMPLTRIGSLLPYHSHVDAETVASALNRMIDEADRGRTVFYRFYSESERQREPARGNTGLFFFRGRPGAPFAVVCPGGGFSYVASVHEGFPHAAAISGKGFNAFVLKYRAGHGEAVATRDLAAAVTYIHRNAEALGVGTSGYSLWGAPPARGWPPRSARTAWRAMEAAIFRGRRPSSSRTPGTRITPPPSRPRSSRWVGKT